MLQFKNFVSAAIILCLNIGSSTAIRILDTTISSNAEPNTSIDDELPADVAAICNNLVNNTVTSVLDSKARDRLLKYSQIELLDAQKAIEFFKSLLSNLKQITGSPIQIARGKNRYNFSFVSRWGGKLATNEDLAMRYAAVQMILEKNKRPTDRILRAALASFCNSVWDSESNKEINKSQYDEEDYLDIIVRNKKNWEMAVILLNSEIQRIKPHRLGTS